MLLKCVSVLVAIAISPALLAASSDESAFIQQYSQHAYDAVFGVPVAASPLVEHTEWHFSLEHSSQFSGGHAGDERLRLDGESSRVSLGYRRRLGLCSQFEWVLPLIAHNPGEFDEAIDSWHRFFGFPDAQRDQTPFNVLNYRYEDEHGVRHQMSSPQSGIGDIHIAFQRVLRCHTQAVEGQALPYDQGGAFVRNRSLMWRLGVKLPTGNPRELRGSGEFDVYADIQLPLIPQRRSGHSLRQSSLRQSSLRQSSLRQSPLRQSPLERWRAAVAAGVLLSGSTDRFATHRPLAFYASAGAQFVYRPELRLMAQLDVHSPFYDSALRELGSPTVNLLMGFRYAVSTAYTFELSISEDVAIDTAPDIVVRLALQYRPRYKAAR